MLHRRCILRYWCIRLNQSTEWQKAEMLRRSNETHLESITGQNRAFVVVATMVKTNMLITVR